MKELHKIIVEISSADVEVTNAEGIKELLNYYSDFSVKEIDLKQEIKNYCKWAVETDYKDGFSDEMFDELYNKYLNKTL